MSKQISSSVNYINKVFSINKQKIDDINIYFFFIIIIIYTYFIFFYIFISML